MLDLLLSPLAALLLLAASRFFGGCLAVTVDDGAVAAAAAAAADADACNWAPGVVLPERGVPVPSDDSALVSSFVDDSSGWSLSLPCKVR